MLFFFFPTSPASSPRPGWIIKCLIRLILCVIIHTLTLTVMFAQINNPRNIPVTWKTDTALHAVALSEITVALPRGAFPKIDYPEFIGKEAGLASFFSHEPVISVEINGEPRAYPLNMLTVHEISNDSLGGIPILVTYCPLCNAGLVYDRRLQYKDKEYLLAFEVSGMLRNSDMMMFDRQTESWWQQLTGQALVGKLTGAELQVLPSLIISVAAFFNRYPEGKILSKNTGDPRTESHYGRNPYVDYDQPSALPMAWYFDPEKVDARLPAMERVVDVHAAGAYKIYPFSLIAKKGVINDTFQTKHIVVFYQSGTVSVLDQQDIRQSRNIGSATVFNANIKDRVFTFYKAGADFIDDQSHSQWDITGRCMAGPMKGSQLTIEPHSNHFAFAWLAFHPDTIIYGE